MSNYPAYKQSDDSAEQRLSGREVDRATNGAPKVRSFFTAEKKQFKVEHPYVTTAEKVAFEAFYTANALVTFSFVWKGDGATYTCLFDADAPVYRPLTPGYWAITATLVQA